jgi:hypothetical protein
MATKIPAIKTAVVEQLQAASSLEGITITGDKEPERDVEYIWVYRGRGKREFKLLSGGGGSPVPQDETVRITMRVVSITGTDELGPSEERVEELVDAAEEALRADTTLGGEAFWSLIEDIELEPFKLDKRWAFHALLTLTAKCRI